jgi:hypothetical protein
VADNPVDIVIEPVTDGPIAEVPLNRYANLPSRAIVATDYIIAISNDGHLFRAPWESVLALLGDYTPGPGPGTPEAWVLDTGEAWVTDTGEAMVL